MTADSDSRVVIRASAGAGKTYQLVNQYLRHLHAGADPTAMLAVTFTRKAAGEILASIVARLIDAAADGEKRTQLGAILSEPDLTAQDCHRLLDRLVVSLHRLSVGTIDSFFHRLASAFRWELDLPVDPVMADALDPEVVALRQEVIAEVLAAGEPGELTDLFRRHHGDRAARAVGQALDTLVLKLHDVWRLVPGRDLWDRLEVPTALTEAELARSLQALDGLQDEVPITGRGTPDGRWLKAHAAHVEAARAGDWASFLGKGIVSHLTPESGTFYSKPIPQPWWDVCAPLIQHARSILLEEVRQKHLASHDLLSRFDAGWFRLRRGRRLLMFSDLTHKLARDLPALLAGELPRVRHRLDAGLDHLLLDEFQDTSPAQWQILEPFADSVTDGAEGRSLFVVGDMKQAIYGWRGGNAALFGAVEDRYHITAQDLAVSYRSVPAVMDLVNAVFTNVAGCPTLLDHAADAQAARRFAGDFRPHRAEDGLSALPGYVVLRSTAAPPEEEHRDRPDELLEEFPEVPAAAVISEPEDIEPPTSHEDSVARYVAALHQAHPAGSIAVLVRTNVMAARLLHEFRRTTVERSPLPVSGEGGSPLAGCPPVAAILSAFALADCPADTASAYHVATSPLGPLLGLAPATYGKNAAEVSRQLRRDLQREGHSALLGRWIPALAPACDAPSLERLQQLLELAQRYEPTARPGGFVDFVEATSVEQGTTAPIRVMTIHAAKGLEFDTVVLPELDNLRRDVFPVLLPREDEAGPPVAVLPFGNEGIRALSPQLEDAYKQERSRRRYEDLCLLYVALTRAKRAVHMLIRPKNPKRKEHRLYADTLREALNSEMELDEVGDQVFYETGDAQWFRDAGAVPTSPVLAPALPAGALEIRLAPASSPRRAWSGTSPSAREGDGRVTGAEILATAGAHARMRGLVFHEWFQQVRFVDEPDGVPDDVTLRALAQRRAPALAAADLDTWLRDFRQALETPAIRAVLQRDGARVLWRERAFALRDDGRLQQGRFDRVAVWPDRALLVDYKTDLAGPAARERYQPQVDSYRQAVASLCGLLASAVETRLVFVATGDVLLM